MRRAYSLIVLLLYSKLVLAQLPLRVGQALGVVESDADSVGVSLWGHTLRGPLLIVEPEGRRCFATEHLGGFALEPAAGYWAGYYPDSLPLANTSLRVQGQVLTVVVTPGLADTITGIRGLVLHELFHGLQLRQGWPQHSPVCSHLASERNRTLLRMEVNALFAALTSSDLSHLRNALAFRYQRLVAGTEADSTHEYQLEFNEGLAEYTGLKGSKRTPAETVAYLTGQLISLTKNTFERSAAYLTGPLYGLLLDRYAPHWRKTPIPTMQPLSRQLSAAVAFWPTPADTLRLATLQIYGADSIRADEAERSAAKRALYNELTVRYLRQAQLKVPFLQMNIQFDPNRVDDFAPHGSVYYKAVIRDLWGQLEASQSILLGYDWSHCRVPAPTVQNTSFLEGAGYTLRLNDGWKLHGPDSEGNYTLRKD